MSSITIFRIPVTMRTVAARLATIAAMAGARVSVDEEAFNTGHKFSGVIWKDGALRTVNMGVMDGKEYFQYPRCYDFLVMDKDVSDLIAQCEKWKTIVLHKSKPKSFKPFVIGPWTLARDPGNLDGLRAGCTGFHNPGIKRVIRELTQWLNETEGHTTAVTPVWRFPAAGAAGTKLAKIAMLAGAKVAQRESALDGKCNDYVYWDAEKQKFIVKCIGAELCAYLEHGTHLFADKDVSELIDGVVLVRAARSVHVTRISMPFSSDDGSTTGDITNDVLDGAQVIKIRSGDVRVTLDRPRVKELVKNAERFIKFLAK